MFPCFGNFNSQTSLPKTFVTLYPRNRIETITEKCKPAKKICSPLCVGCYLCLSLRKCNLKKYLL